MEKFPQQTYFNFEFDKSCPKIISSTIEEILSIAKNKIGKPIHNLKVLDVGSGAGQYTFEIEKYVKKVMGVEPFKPAYLKALNKKKRTKSKVHFVNTLIEDFKTNERFDLILCLATLEHMTNAEKAFTKIFKLMTNNGIIYLTAPNKLWPLEPHYGLLFLSWLPLPLANAYVRVTKRGSSYEDSAYSRSYFGIKKFFNKFPCEYSFLVPNPNAPYLGLGVTTPMYYKVLRNVGIWLINKFPWFWIISKGFIVVVQKK